MRKMGESFGFFMGGADEGDPVGFEDDTHAGVVFSFYEEDA